MTNLRKIFALVLICCSILPLIAGGNQQTTSRVPATRTITIFHHMSEQAKRDALDAMVEIFKQQNPGAEVRIEAVDFSNYDAALRTRIAGGDTPDIIFGRPARLQELVQAGHIMDLTNESFVRNIAPSPLASMELDGKIFGIPMSISAMGVFYNKDIFTQRGYTVPETRSQMITLLQRMRSDGITPLVFGFRDAWTAQVLFQSDFYGGPLRSTPQLFAETMNGTRRFEDFPAVVSAFERYREILAFGNADPFSVDYGRSLADFSAGRGAMLVQGLWALGDIRRNNPNGNFGFFLNPSSNNLQDNFLNIQADDGFMIASRTRHPDLAKAFLSVMASGEGSARWAQIATSIPTAINAQVPTLDPVLLDVQKYIVANRAFNFETLPSLSGQFDATWRQAQEEFAADPNAQPRPFLQELSNRFNRIRATQ